MGINKQKIINGFPAIMTAAIWATPFSARLNNILIIIFAAYCLYTGLKYPRKILRTDIVLFLPILLFLVYLIGLFWTLDMKEGWVQIEKRIGLAGFPLMFLFLRGKFTQEDITRMLYAFLIICLTISVICYANALWNTIQHGALPIEGRERNYYYFSYLSLTSPVGIDPIYLSLYINFSIVILLFKPFKNRIITISLLVYFIAFILLIASKAGILGAIIVFLIYFLSLIKNRLLSIGICLLIVCLFAVTLNASKFLRERFIVPTEFDYELPWAGDWNSTSQRLAIWGCAIETIGEVFPFGYGTANGQKALNRTYVEKKYVRGYEDDYNAHSEYLYTLLDTGIFGLVVLLGILLWPLFQSIRKRNTVFMYFLILIFFYFFVEAVLVRRAGIDFFSFFYGLLALNGLVAARKTQTNISDEI